MKRKIPRWLIVLIVIAIIVPLYVWRLHAVDEMWHYPTRTYYAIGDEIPLGQNYFDNPQFQRSDGYTLKVIGAKVYDIEDLLAEHDYTMEDFTTLLLFNAIREYQRYALVVEVEVRNDENTETGLDMEFWRIEQGTSYHTWDPMLYTALNPETNGSARVRFPIGRTKTFFLPYGIHPERWVNESLELLDYPLYLVVSDVPESIRIQIGQAK